MKVGEPYLAPETAGARLYALVLAAKVRALSKRSSTLQRSSTRRSRANKLMGHCDGFSQLVSSRWTASPTSFRPSTEEPKTDAQGPRRRPRANTRRRLSQRGRPLPLRKRGLVRTKELARGLIGAQEQMNLSPCPPRVGRLILGVCRVSQCHCHERDQSTGVAALLFAMLCFAIMTVAFTVAYICGTSGSLRLSRCNIQGPMVPSHGMDMYPGRVDLHRCSPTGPMRRRKAMTSPWTRATPWCVGPRVLAGLCRPSRKRSWVGPCGP